MKLEIVTKELPENIVIVYTQIFNKTYGIINKGIPKEQQLICTEICHYFFSTNKESVMIPRGHALSYVDAISFKKFIRKRNVLDEQLLTCVENGLRTCLKQSRKFGDKVI